MSSDNVKSEEKSLSSTELGPRTFFGVWRDWVLAFLKYIWKKFHSPMGIYFFATWLISENARKNFMKDMNEEFLKNNSLLNNSEELSFTEFVILTRSSPAKSLGIGSIKGNLGTGADADLNILDLNIKELDTSKDYKEVEKTLQNIEYVLKDGKVVKKKEIIDINHHGKLFWTKGNVEKEKKSTLLSKKKEFYQVLKNLSLKDPEGLVEIPEDMTSFGEIKVVATNCIACMKCVEICPEQLLEKLDLFDLPTIFSEFEQLS